MPGKTLGSATLQNDTRTQILFFDQALFPECDTRRIVNTELLEVSEAARRGRGAWKERWHLDRCGKVIPYDVTYVPSEKGGTDIQLHLDRQAGEE